MIIGWSIILLEALADKYYSKTRVYYTQRVVNEDQ